MFQPIENKVVVKVAAKHIQSVTNIMRLSALQNNTTIDPSDFVTICGDVMSLPRRIHGSGYEGFSMEDIQVGDLAIFSYQVIYDMVYKGLDDKVEYRNMVIYEGEEYFLADIRNIFGVVRGDDVIMINGYTMLAEYPAGVILLQQSSKKVKGTTTSDIMHIGSAKKGTALIDAVAGDKVLFSPFRAQHYQIGAKPFIILRQNQLLARF